MIDNDPSCLPGQTSISLENGDRDTKRDLCPRVSKSSGKQSWKVIGKQARRAAGYIRLVFGQSVSPPTKRDHDRSGFDASGNGIVATLRAHAFLSSRAWIYENRDSSSPDISRREIYWACFLCEAPRLLPVKSYTRARVLREESVKWRAKITRFWILMAGMINRRN